MSQYSQKFYRKNALLVKSLVVDEKLVNELPQILLNCRELVELRIVDIQRPDDDAEHFEGIWNGTTTRNNSSLHDARSQRSTMQDEWMDEDEQRSDESDNEGESKLELDVKLIASLGTKLKKLRIGPAYHLVRQTCAPPTLAELEDLESLDLSSVGEGLLCDRSRDEWNIRSLAQSSSSLKHLDLRGCYLHILSLGWLRSSCIESLHLYYQVPAVSVLSRWAKSLKYLTLARISERFRRYRSMGPSKPGEELDACLIMLASSGGSPLEQLDLQESDCSLDSLKLLIENCTNLSYLDTSLCSMLPQHLQVRCEGREALLRTYLQDI